MELFTFLSIVLVPSLGALGLYLYKSKCSNITLCWGLLEIDRDVVDEMKLDMNVENHNHPQPLENNTI